jgi:hypothetical protein
MDRLVLEAYGWGDLIVPPYVTPSSSEESKALEAFSNEVVDRLFVLNAERARAEAIQGRGADKQKGGKRKKQASDELQGKAATPRSRKKT